MDIKSYRELKVWQLGMDIACKVYQLTDAFPKQEMYGLSSQIQPSAVSIPSNIAEGHARDSTKEFLHHISIALGSLAELETQVLLAERLSYVSQLDLDSFCQQLEELGKMLRGLQKALKSKL